MDLVFAWCSRVFYYEKIFLAYICIFLWHFSDHEFAKMSW